MLPTLWRLPNRFSESKDLTTAKQTAGTFSRGLFFKLSHNSLFVGKTNPNRRCMLSESAVEENAEVRVVDQVKIGIFIAELRRENKMTQETLGQKIGVTNKTVSRWETGVSQS